MRKCPTRYRGGSSSTETGEVARRTSAERRNPARGVRSLVDRSTRLTWGVSVLATAGTGPDRSGDRGQIPRPRRAQPQKASNCLSVSLAEDGAEP